MLCIAALALLKFDAFDNMQKLGIQDALRQLHVRLLKQICSYMRMPKTLYTRQQNEC